jgi:2-methylcitrate dehydratase PrpD
VIVTAPAAQRLAGFATQLQLEDVPAEVVDAARLHLLDTIGCGLAAHALAEAPYGHALAEEGPPGAASVIGVAEGRDPATAALANGIACHALDFDDTHAGSIAHVSAVVAPAALAAAQAADASLEALLVALLIGNEITCRVGLPAGDGFHLRGFHPTAICGVFGATAAVGRLVGLTEEQAANALGIAGSMAAGLLAYLSDGSATKRIHPGWMAHSAHAAVQLARLGATGPMAVLEGQSGVYRSFLGRSDLDVPTDDLGRDWQTPLIAFKPYPACHFLHAAIDATEEVRRRTGMTPADIERITVFAPQAGIDMVLEPLDRKHRPETTYEGKFSAPFAIAALLEHGRVDVTTFTEPALRDEALLETAAKVDYALHDYPTFPGSFPGGVRVRLVDGSEHEAHLAHQRGGEDSPMGPDEIRVKFDVNARLALPADLADELGSALLTDPVSGGLESLRIVQRAARGIPG